MNHHGVSFTLLSDAVLWRPTPPVVHSKVAVLYGQTARTDILGIQFSAEDKVDDIQAREMLSRRTAFKTSNTDMPCLIPPVALRAAVSSVVWTLLRRWGRGNWPMKILSDIESRPKSLRQVSSQLKIDPGHLSRVAKGSATLSLPGLGRLLRAAGYRIGITEIDSEESICELILSGQWVGRLRHSFTDPLKAEAPLPTMIPEKGAPNVQLYNRFENRYLDELAHFIQHDQTNDGKLIGMVATENLVSTSHFYRVVKGERSLSIDMLASLAARIKLAFVFLPSPIAYLSDDREGTSDRSESTLTRSATVPPEAWRITDEQTR